MTVPVELDINVLRFKILLRPVYEVFYSFRSRMTACITEAETRCARIDCRIKKRRKGLGFCADSVFSNEHDRQTFFHRETHCLNGVLHHLLQRPLLGVYTDRTAADECAYFYRYSHFLRNFNNRSDIRENGTRRTIRSDIHFIIGDLLHKSKNVIPCSRTGAGKSYVSRMNPKIFHQVQQLFLLFNGRVLDRRRLKPVPQGFVVKLYIFQTRQTPITGSIPIVNKISNIFLFTHQYSPSSAAFKLRLSLLKKRIHTLFHIFCSAKNPEPVGFYCKSFVKRHVHPSVDSFDTHFYRNRRFG